MTNSQNYHDLAAQFASNPIEEREIEAKLSIAYEQRTANLLAVLNTYNPDGSRVLEKQPAMELMENIIERLGLDK